MGLELSKVQISCYFFGIYIYSSKLCPPISSELFFILSLQQSINFSVRLFYTFCVQNSSSCFEYFSSSLFQIDSFASLFHVFLLKIISDIPSILSALSLPILSIVFCTSMNVILIFFPWFFYNLFCGSKVSITQDFYSYYISSYLCSNIMLSLSAPFLYIL